MRLAIVGGRDFDDYMLMAVAVHMWVRTNGKPSALVSGGAKGADSLAFRLSIDTEIPMAVWTADWDRYGKAAGMIRNGQIEKDSDACIAFWDGISKGTKNTINRFAAAGKPLKIINY